MPGRSQRMRRARIRQGGAAPARYRPGPPFAATSRHTADGARTSLPGIALSGWLLSNYWWGWDRPGRGNPGLRQLIVSGSGLCSSSRVAPERPGTACGWPPR
jgi:hypothetical protein